MFQSEHNNNMGMSSALTMMLTPAFKFAFPPPYFIEQLCSFVNVQKKNALRNALSRAFDNHRLREEQEKELASLSPRYLLL